MPKKNLTEVKKKMNAYIDRLKESMGPQNQMIEAIENLKNLTEELYTKDELGFYPALTPERLDNLMGHYADAYSATIAAINENAEIRQVADEMLNLLAIDMNTLLDIQPDEKRSLPEIMTYSRSMLVDTDLTQHTAVGANSNVRYLMQVNENGREVKGLFTKEKTVEFFSAEKFNHYLDEAIKTDRRLSNMVSYKDTRTLLNRITRKMDGQKIAVLLGNAFQENANEEFGEELGEEEANAYADRMMNICNRLAEVSPEAKAYIEGIRTISFQYGLGLEAEEGSSITGRNVAMSRISNLMGINESIAQSRFMKIEDKNGTVTNGIFMETANGIDYTKVLPEQANSIDMENPVTPEGIRSIANLQVLDFICQNVDRHQSNFFYQFNEDGTKLTGIQGIDNDYSFGTIATDSGAVTQHDIELDGIQIIPEKLYKRLSAVDETMLAVALLDTGLTLKEIDAAAERVNQVKEAVRQNKIRVVNDSEIAQLNFKQLKKNGSLFKEVAYAFDNIKTRAQRNQKESEGKVESRTPAFKEVIVINGLDKHTMNEYKKKAADYSKRIFKSQNNIFGYGSGQFQNLETAVKNFRKAVNLFADENSRDNRFILQKTLEDMKSTAEKYIAIKDPDTWNSNTKERIRIAEEIKNFAKKNLMSFIKAGQTESEREAADYRWEIRKDALKDASFRIYDAYVNYLEQKGDNNNVRLLKHNKKQLISKFAETRAAITAAASPDLKPMELARLGKEAFKECSAAAKRKAGKAVPENQAAKDKVL